MSSSSHKRPNMRVQRTRSSPSALRSSLTRHPLGGERLSAVLAALIVVMALPCISCSSTSARVGRVDDSARQLDPALLAEVNKEMTLGEVFKTLGPAHWDRCTHALCWAWFFTNHEMLTVWADSVTADAKLSKFEVLPVP